MAHVILRDNEIAVRIQKTRKMVIAADVLGNAVYDLNDRLGAFLGKPFAAVELPAAARRNVENVHTVLLPAIKSDLWYNPPAIIMPDKENAANGRDMHET